MEQQVLQTQDTWKLHECKYKPVFLDEDLVMEFSKQEGSREKPNVNNILLQTESRDHRFHLNGTEKMY